MDRVTATVGRSLAGLLIAGVATLTPAAACTQERPVSAAPVDSVPFVLEDARITCR